jgi:broad specificity phosphatase PhoE
VTTSNRLPARAFLLAVLALVSTTNAPPLAAGGSPADETSAAESPARILLVRHAETAGEGSDPGLSEAGRRRAERLADVLAGEGVERILSTDLRRTRETAAPLAARLGLDLETYDPRELPALAERLRAEGGVVLVVGHSNTTPALVHLLGGDPGEPIAHDEHDRLYRVDLPSGETALERDSATLPQAHP